MAHSNTICTSCFKNQDCELHCEALRIVIKLNELQKTKEKTTLIKNLSRQLNIQDVERSRKLKRLGQTIINHFPEFSFINEYGIKIGYVLSYERKNGEKIVFASCRKVNKVYQAYLPFDFIIIFYEHHTGHMNENQLKILMRHEQKHISRGMKG